MSKTYDLNVYDQDGHLTVYHGVLGLEVGPPGELWITIAGGSFDILAAGSWSRVAKESENY